MFTKLVKCVLVTPTHREYIEKESIGETECTSYTKAFLCDMCTIIQIQYDIEEVISVQNFTLRLKPDYLSM